MRDQQNPWDRVSKSKRSNKVKKALTEKCPLAYIKSRSLFASKLMIELTCVNAGGKKLKEKEYLEDRERRVFSISSLRMLDGTTSAQRRND